MTVLGLVQELYDASHGLSIAQVIPRPLDSDPGARIAGWREFWRALGFRTNEPTGSSRLMELALVQSSAGGSPKEMLQGLFLELGEGNPAIGTALEHFLREVWAAALCDKDRFGEAFDFVGDLHCEPVPAQAYLILRFVRDRQQYSQEAVARLDAALRGQRLENLSLEAVFGD